MFWPLLTASWERNGKALLRHRVFVYTSDGQVHIYRIARVKRHAVDFKITEHKREQLVLQTSEGPHGTIPKLQVLALPIKTQKGEPHKAPPKPYRCDP